MVVIFLLSSVAYYFLLRFVLIHELDEVLYDKKEKIERFVKINGKLPSFRDLDEFVISYTAGAGSTKSYIRQVSMIDPEEKHLRDFRQLTYSQPIGSQTYILHIAIAVEGTRVLLRAIVAITVLTLLLIILISILLNRLLLKKLWRPFYEMIAALRSFKISHSNNLALPVTDIDEFAFLKDNLSHTIKNAQQEYHLLKEFTENASHEFQTPLAIIRSRLDLLIQDESLSARQTELLTNTYGAITKLSRLNQSLLLLTKIENNQFPEVESINLREKLEEKIGQLQELWSGIDISLDTTLEDTILHSNPALVDILLNNLLSNAGKHNLKGGSIRIVLKENCLSIENTGQLKPLDDKRLFRRFYKEEQYNSSNGLGLSIVKEICEREKMQINYAFIAQRHVFTISFVP
jgi:signal transduction histidine kinase